MFRLKLLSLVIAVIALVSSATVTITIPQTWEFRRLLLLSFLATLFIWAIYEITVKSAIREELPVKVIAYEVGLIWILPMLAGVIIGSLLT